MNGFEQTPKGFEQVPEMNGFTDMAIMGFLTPGKAPNPHVDDLKDAVMQLCHMTQQKTAGQKPYAKGKDISFDNLERIKFTIICEAVLLVLSGKLDGINEGER